MATVETPPQPNAIASLAAHCLRIRSSIIGAKARNFSRTRSVVVASRMRPRCEIDSRLATGFCSSYFFAVPKDADEELQAIFKEVVADQIQAIREAHPEEEVRVWFEDEARFGPQGTLCRVWARRGSRPRGVKQTQYGFLYVLTAVCVTTGAASGLISPTLNAGVVNVFLKQFSEELPAGVRAILVWDGAGYHTGGGLVVPPNVDLIQLVPYSPELNPVENLWHYLRSHYWSLRVYADYEALEEAAMAGWRSVCLRPESVRSICAAPYIAHCA
jgi:transposase